MSAVANDLVERTLAAAEPAERPLRRQLLDLLLAPSGPARMTYRRASPSTGYWIGGPGERSSTARRPSSSSTSPPAPAATRYRAIFTTRRS